MLCATRQQFAVNEQVESGLPGERACATAFEMMRLLALLVGFGLAGLIVAFGLLITVRILFPAWYAVPAAIVQMTGQRVPPAPVQVADVVVADRAGAPPGGDGSAPVVTVTPLPTASPVSTDTASPSPMAATPPSAATAPAPQVEEPSPGLLLPRQRFNILLLGSDNDLKFPASAVLTQAMILVSIDPTTKDVAMISIPRDFWVPIKGYGSQKIDVAYEVGGVALARSTVESLFGVTVDYYAWVGLSGLVQVIDTLDGVDVTVQHPILDDAYPDDLNSDDPYAFFRLYIPAGPQHLDGRTALEYVRSRHGDLMSDFGRSERQQQVLVAIKSRLQATSAIERVPQLVAALNGSVKTDLPLPAIVQLAALGRDIPPGSILRLVLAAPDFASLGNSPDGTQQVVFPNWTAIRPVIARLLHPPKAGAAAVATSP